LTYRFYRLYRERKRREALGIVETPLLEDYDAEPLNSQKYGLSRNTRDSTYEYDYLEQTGRSVDQAEGEYPVLDELLYDSPKGHKSPWFNRGKTIQGEERTLFLEFTKKNFFFFTGELLFTLRDSGIKASLRDLYEK
jgi:hypothetical protein